MTNYRFNGLVSIENKISSSLNLGNVNMKPRQVFFDAASESK